MDTLAQVVLSFDKSNTANKSDSSDGALVSNPTSGLEESDAVAMNNYQSTLITTPRGGDGALIGGSNSTNNTDQLTHSGEVNGALSWAESAYHSFWFFAWTLTAVAVAIGTQML